MLMMILWIDLKLDNIHQIDWAGFFSLHSSPCGTFCGSLSLSPSLYTSPITSVIIIIRSDQSICCTILSQLKISNHAIFSISWFLSHLCYSRQPKSKVFEMMIPWIDASAPHPVADTSNHDEEDETDGGDGRVIPCSAIRPNMGTQ